MLKAENNGQSVHEVVQRDSYDVTVGDATPLADWRGMSESEHFVQFYEADEFLLNSLSGYIGTALNAGDAAVVVATKEHREGLEARLAENGLDVAAASAREQYVALDAADTLSKFMIDGQPEPGRFAEVVGGIISRLADGRPRVRAYGEMVALLWAEGNHDAAIRLEELWNDLGKAHSFSLFCAYPMNGFGGEAFAEPLSGVCTAHSRVIPAESYTALTAPDDRLRTVIQLQQKARSLEAVKEQLEVQVEDLRRLHEMSVSLTSTLDIESVLEEVLRAAMAVQSTDMGVLSLCDPQRDGLNIKVHSGFGEALKQVEWVPSGAGAAGTCYEQRRRVVVEDVEVDPIFAPYREVARAVGFRACHSTPLFTRTGDIIGVLSVHFREPHRPSERELRLIDLYARMAADTIENARLHQQAQRELEERKQLLIREQAARSEAESANRLKDEFLATVSHELRTPLSAILGWSVILRTNKFDREAAARALETIERNAKAQAQIIEDLLDVSRIITGRLRLDARAVEPAAIIAAAIDAIRPASEAKSISVNSVLEPLTGVVWGDPARLQQVMWNLLSNAVKFTPAGGSVEVSLGHVGSHIQISVRDTGQGIDPEFLPFVFERFRQADSTITRRQGGLGLGLAIVRHMVEMHGGSVRAESEGVGQGATFIVDLPFMAAVTDGRQTKQLTTEASATTIDCSPTLEEIRVLIVDDEADARALLTTIIENCGATVAAVASAAEALEVLEHFESDILISDIGMPGEDGYSLIRKVRALGPERRGRIPAIALTAYAKEEDRVQALQAGYNVHVAKPVNPEELVAVVGSLAGLSERS